MAFNFFLMMLDFFPLTEIFLIMVLIPNLMIDIKKDLSHCNIESTHISSSQVFLFK